MADETRKIESAVKKMSPRGWWSDVLLKTAFDRVLGDALIDTGSPYTVIPSNFLIELGIETPDYSTGPWIKSSSIGTGRSAIVRVNAGLTELGRAALLEVIVLEAEAPSFDFVLLGIDYLDKVGALLSFGEKREMAGAEKRSLDGVPVIEIPTPLPL